MNLLETVEQDTMPTHYKQMTQAEMIARVTEIKAQLGENSLFPVTIIKKMRSFHLPMRLAIPYN